VVNIAATAFLKDSSCHLADKIKYSVQFKKNRSDGPLATRTVEYQFSALDPNQSAGGDLDALWKTATSGDWFKF
jgi:hypothetical protein